MIEMIPVSQRKCIREDKIADAFDIANFVKRFVYKPLYLNLQIAH